MEGLKLYEMGLLLSQTINYIISYKKAASFALEFSFKVQTSRFLFPPQIQHDEKEPH